jgi:hypothetical protein
MPASRECPSCKASLPVAAEEELPLRISCPFCGTSVARSPDSGLPDDPYAPPQAGPDDGFDPASGFLPEPIPPSFGGKLLLAFRLLLADLPLLAALVLTVWGPGNLVIEWLIFHSPTPAEDDAIRFVQMTNLIELFFGPLYAGAVLIVVAGRLTGTRVSYREAMQVGLHNWGRLFGARLVSSLFIGLGLLAFVVPGIILMLRYSLIDPVVVLEGAGANDSRERSAELARGRLRELFAGHIILFALLLGTSILANLIPTLDESLLNPWVAAACDAIPNVVGLSMLTFRLVYFWDARERKPLPRDLDPDA